MKRPRTSGILAPARRVAKRFGLFILENGDRLDPHWSVMGLRTGRTLAVYWPNSGRWKRVNRDNGGVEKNWPKFFALIAEFDQPLS